MTMSNIYNSIFNIILILATFGISLVLILIDISLIIIVCDTIAKCPKIKKKKGRDNEKM